MTYPNQITRVFPSVSNNLRDATPADRFRLSDRPTDLAHYTECGWNSKHDSSGGFHVSKPEPRPTGGA